MLSIHRELFLALKKVRITNITSHQVPFTRQKIPSKISNLPLTDISKTMLQVSNWDPDTWKGLLTLESPTIPFVENVFGLSCMRKRK